MKNSRNLTMTWKIVREAIKGKKKNDTAIPLINTNGKKISNPQEIANVFNEHFTTIVDKIAVEIPPSDKPADEHCKPVNCTFNSSTNPITTKELLETVKNTV
jgi:hypothetical protein